MQQPKRDFVQEKDINFKQWLESYKKAIDVNIITSITNQNGVIVYANEKFCEISQFDRSELIGQTHKVVSSGYHPKEFFDDLWNTIKNGGIWTGEIKNKAKHGNYYWVNTVIIPVQSENELQYLSLRTVITEKKELERKREEYLKSIEELLFMTSHKIRQPLTTIKGIIQMDNEYISKEDFKQISSYICNSVDELDLVTREITHYLHNLRKII